MHPDDFLKIVGAAVGTGHATVAGMLARGYGFAGYYSRRLNEGLEDTGVLVNARLVDLRGSQETSSIPHVSDFAEFVEEIVRQNYPTGKGKRTIKTDVYGKTIPLAAIDFSEMVVVYPVAQIGKMMARLRPTPKSKLPSFLDFDNKSVLLKLLRAKIW